MKTLRNIFTNPVAIAVAVVHWLVVIFAFLTEDNPFDKNPCFHCNDTLFSWLYNINIIHFMFVEFVVVPALKLFSEETFLVNVFLSFIIIISITFQWLSLGYLLSLITDLVKPRKIKIFSND